MHLQFKYKIMYSKISEKLLEWTCGSIEIYCFYVSHVSEKAHSKGVSRKPFRILFLNDMALIKPHFAIKGFYLFAHVPGYSIPKLVSPKLATRSHFNGNTFFYTLHPARFDLPSIICSSPVVPVAVNFPHCNIKVISKVTPETSIVKY